jgi:hypothetical protein
VPGSCANPALYVAGAVFAHVTCLKTFETDRGTISHRDERLARLTLEMPVNGVRNEVRALCFDPESPYQAIYMSQALQHGFVVRRTRDGDFRVSFKGFDYRLHWYVKRNPMEAERMSLLFYGSDPSLGPFPGDEITRVNKRSLASMLLNVSIQT